MNLFRQATRLFSSSGKSPVNVAITGATGNISYSLLFRIASGELLGVDQPVNIHLHDLPMFEKKMQGVEMEIYDCAFPLVNSIKVCTEYDKAFDNVKYAFLVGSKPRTKGMERSDLIKDNGAIFVDLGAALDQYADPSLKAVVVGNPCNTNCLIAASKFKRLPKSAITAMTRLDHNRALSQLKLKLNEDISDITNIGIFGNHSPTMYPYLKAGKVQGKDLLTAVGDDKWVKETFNPRVQKRGAEIIEFRGGSSAASAGSSALDHIRDWEMGAKDWLSMAIDAKGNQYGIDEGLIFSFPVICKDGKYEVVNGLEICDYSKQMLKATEDELKAERDFVQNLL